MPRNSGGTYSLPAGNPVVTNTTIASAWGNGTMSDLATALTESLSRNGQGGMLAQLRLDDGSSGTPGLSWGTETTAGFYRAGSGDFRFVVGGTTVYRVTSSRFEVNQNLRLINSLPWMSLEESDATTDNKVWAFRVEGEQFAGSIFLDTLSGGVNWLEVNRTTNTVDTVNFPNGTLQYGGVEVGFRSIPQNAQTGNYTTVLADGGKHIFHDSGAGAGDTYTIPANGTVAYPLGTVITFVNRDSNNITIAITTDTMLLAGTTTTGSRTLQQNGLATAMKVAPTVWIISGVGLV